MTIEAVTPVFECQGEIWTQKINTRFRCSLNTASWFRLESKFITASDFMCIKISEVELLVLNYSLR